MSTEHTPGPWEVGDTDEGHIIKMGRAITSPSHYPVHMAVNYDHGIPPYGGDCTHNQFLEAEANARLIAAAPALLAACEAALARREGEVVEPCESGLCIQLRAAIALARGDK